jgi:hypothetical protein
MGVIGDLALSARIEVPINQVLEMGRAHHRHRTGSNRGQINGQHVAKAIAHCFRLFFHRRWSFAKVLYGLPSGAGHLAIL